MKEPVWISKTVVLALQDELISEFGGLPGLRDEGLLEAALARPQQHFSYSDPDLCAMAAVYVSAIIRNHPFLDGNKRVGFVVGAIFLERNGKSFNPTEAEAVQAVRDLAASKITEEEFAIWIEGNCE